MFKAADFIRSSAHAYYVRNWERNQIFGDYFNVISDR